MQEEEEEGTILSVFFTIFMGQKLIFLVAIIRGWGLLLLSKGKGRKAYNVKRCSKRYCKFKEGAKSITFLTYDGTFGALDKVLAFIQQFDAAFGDENFSESSKLRNVSMHFTKATCQWWSGLRTQRRTPKKWKTLCLAIMKSSLHGNTKDKDLTAWQSLKMMPHESIDMYNFGIPT